MALFASRMAALGTENAFKLGEDIARCVERGIDVIRFNLGEPDFDSPDHINQAGIAAIEAGDTHYCDPAGLAPLRETIARHIRDTRGIEADASRVVVTPGGKPPIGYTLQTYVDPGDEVIYPSPGFPIYESWITFAGAKPVPLTVSEDRGFAFAPSDLEELITDRTKLIILCSPSNPTGGVLSKEDLTGIAGVIRDRCGSDVRIYSDEIYEHILFDGEEHHSLASQPGMAERTIVASGCSKSFSMTGWRLGWSLLPTAEEAAAFKQLNINIVSCVAPFVQRAAQAAYDDPASEASIAEMVSAFERRRDWIVPALEAIVGIRCQRPSGAFYVFPNVAGACDRLGVLDAYERMPARIRARTTPAGMLQMFLLYRYGVATMDRNSFGSIGAEGQHYLRISIAASLEKLQEGVARMAKAVDDRDGFRAFLDEEKLWG
ncbi:MAG: pyridoxal phosphate-dependent aminotransferase [Acidobacteriota bacterium]